MCCAHNTNDNWKTSESINWHGNNKGVMWSHLMPRVIRAMQPTSVHPVATLYSPILAPIGNSSISEVEPPGALSSWGYYELQLVKLPLACRESGQTSVMLVSIVEHWTLTCCPVSGSFVHSSEAFSPQSTFRIRIRGYLCKGWTGSRAPWEHENRCTKASNKNLFRFVSALQQSNKTKKQLCHHIKWVGKSHMWARGLPWIVHRHLALMATCIRYTLTVTNVFDTAQCRIFHLGLGPCSRPKTAATKERGRDKIWTLIASVPYGNTDRAIVQCTRHQRTLA